MTRKHKNAFRLSLNQQMMASVALFTLAAIAARPATVSGFEAAIFNSIYGLPDVLRWPFFVITQFGSIYVFVVLVVLYLLMRHYHVVIRLLLTGSLTYLLASMAKDTLGRARPEFLLPNITTLDVWHGAGFPSGHTALATAMAFTLWQFINRKYHWVLVSMVVLVALSRLYLGVHLPLDLVGGFAIGWFSYTLFRHVRIYDVVISPKK